MDFIPAWIAVCLVTSAVTVGLPAQARITHFEILRTETAFGGQTFGSTGAYEHVYARVRGEVDPADPKNAIVQDLNLAPRNPRGLVEYSTDVELLKPADQMRGNRILFFEVNNRGNKLAPYVFNLGIPGSIPDRNALSTAGDGYLMREGYTLVWWGWEMDVRAGWSRVLMPPIVAHNSDGLTITGIVRSEMIAPRAAKTLPIITSQQLQAFPFESFDSYPTAAIDNRTPLADGFLPTLTRRSHEQAPRTVIPNDEWSFGRQPVPDEKHVCYPAGFQPGQLYELVYRARDPMVLGIGFIATRDLGAFLRGAKQDETGAINPIYRPDQLAIIEGSSQSGRMIRSFLALGFNQDESGHQVFDGAYPHIGGGLMPLNIRFGQPLRAWGEQTDHTYPAYDFPFSYVHQFDPLTQRSQGLLDRCTATNTCPKIFHVATALELWEGRQSLGFTDPLGRRDVADPPNVRTFIMASTQHGPAPLPLPTKAPFGNCQQQPNPNPQIWTMRALLHDFTAWVRDDVSPPTSVTPHISDGTLVSADQVRFPEIPANSYGGVERPATLTARSYSTLHVMNYGPLYRSGDSSGIITVEPPTYGGASYGVLLPQVDADGNDIAGIRSVFLQVPIGTYTGWNPGRKDRFENGQCNLQGSFIPFAPTRTERLAMDDSRPSLEERYPTKDAYVTAIKTTAESLVMQRFLLPEDAQTLTDQAAQTGIRGGP
jgi:Alpha/beta hydrolase domain